MTTKTLVAFRAGRMRLDGGQLVADTRKGLLIVVKENDELVHLRWSERNADGSAKQPEEDVVVFPGECTLEQVPGAPRVHVLKFPEEADRNMFFWMQEPKADVDAGNVERLNQSLLGVEPEPEAPSLSASQARAAAAAPSAAAASTSGGGNPALASILSNALAAAGAAPAPPQQATDTNQLAASLLMRMMASQQGGGKGGAAGSQAALARMLMQQGMRMRADDGPGLHEVLHPELLMPVVRAPGALEALAPHLPEEHKTQAALEATLRSPQFMQQLHTFSNAIQSGQLDLAQFGLGNAKGFSVADFLQAIQESVEKEKQQQQQQGEGAGAGAGAGAEGAAPMEQ